MTDEATYAQKPWLRIYDEMGFEHSIDYPVIPLFELVDRAVRDYPESLSVIYAGREMTYKELGINVDKLATALAAWGIVKGDVIAVHLPNIPQFVIGVYGGLKAGATVTLPSPLLSLDDLKDQLLRSEAKVIITEEKNLADIRSIMGETSLKHIVVTTLKDYSAEESPVSDVDGATQLRTLIDSTDQNPPKIEINPKEDTAILFFTGGSTGVPKAPMLTHYNLTTNILQLFDPPAAGMLDPNRGDVSIMGSIPFFHVYGFTCAMNLAINWAGAILMVPNPRDVKEIYNMIKTYRPLFTPGVPTQFMKMAEDEGLDLSELKGTVPFSGSAALPPEVSKRIEKRSDILVSEGYGLSETSPATHSNFVAILKGAGVDFGLPIKIGSIGLPVPDTEVRLIDIDTEETITEPERPGEMLIRGPQLMKGYFPNPGEGLDKDGWLHTGDVAKMDSDGYFYIVDRTKDMINVSGYKVYGRVVDDVLYEHPAVAKAAAIGTPDPEREGSERVKIFIVLNPGYSPTDETGNDIIEHCKKKLPKYAIPKALEFRSELPLTVTEKIFKRKLREEEIDKMKAAGLLK